MREVTVRIARRSDALVDLIHVNTPPGDVFACQRTEHDPGSVTPADGHKEATTGCDGRSSIRSDCRRGRSGDGIGVIEHFDLHAASPYGFDNARMKSGSADFRFLESLRLVSTKNLRVRKARTLRYPCSAS